MLTDAPTAGAGVSRTTRLTTPVDELGDTLTLDDADGLGEGATLPDALPLGVGSTVGPGDGDAVDGGSPTVSVGATVTRTMRGVGLEPTPTAPVDGAADAVGELDLDGAAEPGTVIVTVGEGPAPSGIAGMPCAIAVSNAARLPTPIAHHVAMNGGGHIRINGAGFRTTRRRERRAR